MHYCDKEEELSEKRKNKSKFNKNAEPEDTGVARMKLLCRTLRDDQLGLGSCILIFKTPYMVRETCKADLARIASVAPNLRYADLPQGFFSGDASSLTLRQEIEHRCPEIRKMTYNAGSEKAIENLATGTLWPNLEVLELNNLTLDPSTLRYVLSALESLQELKITGMQVFTDQLFAPSSALPPFPPVRSLVIERCPNVTVRGLQSYLSDPTISASLQHLELTGTGVQAWDVHTILTSSRRLQSFSIVESVEKAFPSHLNIPPLRSNSLQSLHFEITAAPSATYTAGTRTYHDYLATSLLANNLPALRQLYVRDHDFPEALVDFMPPMPGFMADSAPPNPFKPGANQGGNRYSTVSVSSTNMFGASPPQRGRGMPSSPPQQQGAFAPSSFSPPNKMHARGQSQQQGPRMPSGQIPQGLKNPLQIFTKGLDEMEWNVSQITPAQGHGRKASMSGGRPISFYGAGGDVNQAANRLSSMFIGTQKNGIKDDDDFGPFAPPPNVFGGGGARRGSNVSVQARPGRDSIMLPNGFGGVLEKKLKEGESANTGNDLKKAKKEAKNNRFMD